MKQPSLFDTGDEPQPLPAPPDQDARAFAVDPANHVVLEASAGTGKTRVLVDRYVRLLEAGVDPRNILAMTFTRKAAAEMRARVLETIGSRPSASGSAERAGAGINTSDIQITTIDGFCFSLLREFPLEADVDPAFEVADETEMARFVAEALTRTLQIARHLADADESVRLLLAKVKAPVLAEALGVLVDRRHVSVPAVRRFVARHPEPRTAQEASRRFVERLDAALGPETTEALVTDGPTGAAAFKRVSADLVSLRDEETSDPAKVRLLRRRLEAYFLTKDGKPRQRVTKPYEAGHFPSPAAKKRHEAAVAVYSPHVAAALDALDRDVDVLLSRGVLRLLSIAVSTYETLLEEQGLLDFASMLERSVQLLERQEEFARSRLKLQARYHHLLIDEFQDTSRIQWRLIDLLIGAWSEGEGAADAATSVFIVGDRKQSIYRFRHAEVALLDDAAERIGLLSQGRTVRRAISSSFRSVPELLAFVNALAGSMVADDPAPDAWRYDEHDRFPTWGVAPGGRRDGEPVVGIVAEQTTEGAAAAVAGEIARLLSSGTLVRDRQSGPRPVRPDDIAILFRARAGHQYFEDALEDRGVSTYVYKGLGFFDAPEVQDLQALLGFLARPESDLGAAALLRSRFVRLSDQALTDLAPRFSAAILSPDEPPAAATLGEEDASLLTRLREAAAGWLDLSRALPPGELVDRIIRESAYAFELGGRRLTQARENIKKVRALIRRVESRGYTTFDRLASFFETLRAGDDSNAVVEARGSVSLMTIHAAKGLEFPIVFVVNLHAPGRGRQVGFSVIECGADGEPEVTFSTSAGTALEDRRDNEELRRLLYVAMTRARDRLYLAASVQPDGRLIRPRRSLASLLPASFDAAFLAAAVSDAPVVEWETSAGPFAFRVCRAASGAVERQDGPADSAPDEPRAAVEPVSFGPAAALRPGGLTIEYASASLPPVLQTNNGAVTKDVSAARATSAAGDRLVGTLVHRLLQRGQPADASDEELSRMADGLIASDPAFEGFGGRVAEVLGVFRALAGNQELRSLLASGVCRYEVPFSFISSERPGIVVRGVIDCLVERRDGSLTVVEFKTGRPRPEHERQAALYARALEAILGRESVSYRIFYAVARLP